MPVSIRASALPRIGAALAMAWLAAAPLSAHAQDDADAAATVDRAIADLFEERPLSGLNFMLNPRERAALANAQRGTLSDEQLDEVAPSEKPETDVAPEPTIRAAARNQHLGGLIYVSGAEWTAWVNDDRLRPEDNVFDTSGARLVVTGIGPDGVELSWRADSTGQNYREILQPNQTFIAEERRIEEGFVPTPESVAPEPPGSSGGGFPGLSLFGADRDGAADAP